MNHFRVEIIRHPMNAQTGKPNPLRRQVWLFVFIDNSGIVLDNYFMQSKDSTRRRKWTDEEGYVRLSGGHNYAAHKRLKESEVPWPADVREEALQSYVSQIKVGRWSEDFGR